MYTNVFCIQGINYITVTESSGSVGNNFHFFFTVTESSGSVGKNFYFLFIVTEINSTEIDQHPTLPELSVTVKRK
jgi:hypothetical protein